MRLELLRNQYFSVFSTAGCPKVSFLQSFCILSTSHTFYYFIEVFWWLLRHPISSLRIFSSMSFVLSSFFFFPSLQFVFFTFSIHVLTPVTRKDSDAEITVDVRKIILAFLYFRLVSLRSTGSLIFLSLSLNTTILFSCCLRLEKGSSGGTNYGHIKILFTL